MPKTYDDAIFIARRLGIRYLRIDAICIIQDDPEDLRAEAAKMKDIYQNAYCTIAVTGGTSIDQGILLRTSQILNADNLLQACTGGQSPIYFGRHIITPSPIKHRLIADSRLNTRGWIL